MKYKYFWNGFAGIGKLLSKCMPEYEFVYSFPKSHRLDWITNGMLIRSAVKSEELEKYDIVHINNWEGILAYEKKRKDQIFIAEAHGFFVGVNFDRTIVELPFVRRQLSRVLKLLLDARMKRKLRSADLFYVSTPNMLEPARKQIRQDAKWLPLPIDMSLFKPDGKKIRIEGNPSIFFPTRLHAFKNPLYGIKLFAKIKKKFPGAKLHLIRYGAGADPLYDEFRSMLGEEDVIYHEKLPRETLAEYYRSADLVLGQFNENLATLGFIELEALASGAALIVLDRYELKNSLDGLERLAFRLLKDKGYRKRYVESNLRYVKRVHSIEAVAAVHSKNLDGILKMRSRRPGS